MAENRKWMTQSVGEDIGWAQSVNEAIEGRGDQAAAEGGGQREWRGGAGGPGPGGWVWGGRGNGRGVG
jgi:hypothetical protein